MLRQRGEECRGAGEQSFFERLQYELGREAFRLIVSVRRAESRVFLESRVDAAFFVRIRNLDGLQNAWRKAANSEVIEGKRRITFQAANHDGFQLPAVRIADA